MTPAGKRRTPCYGAGMRSILLAASVSSLLAACAGDRGDYPSLARRPAERISGTAPVVTPAPAPPQPPAEVTGQLDGLVAQARAANARFEAATPRTRALVAAANGAAVASEAWSVATVALAELESQRSQAMIALADLDALYAAEGIRQSDTRTLAVARQQVIDIVAAQDAILAELGSGLKS